MASDIPEKHDNVKRFPKNVEVLPVKYKQDTELIKANSIISNLRSVTIEFKRLELKLLRLNRLIQRYKDTHPDSAEIVNFENFRPDK